MIDIKVYLKHNKKLQPCEEISVHVKIAKMLNFDSIFAEAIYKMMTL